MTDEQTEQDNLINKRMKAQLLCDRIVTLRTDRRCVVDPVDILLHALATERRAVWEEAIVLLKRRAEHYTGTRDVSTVTRDIQFNEVMGCIETLEQRQNAEAGR